MKVLLALIAAPPADLPAPIAPEKLVRIRPKDTRSVGERWVGMAHAVPVPDRAFAERFRADENDPLPAGALLDADLTHRLPQIDRRTGAGIELRVEKGAGRSSGRGEALLGLRHIDRSGAEISRSSREEPRGADRPPVRVTRREVNGALPCGRRRLRPHVHPALGSALRVVGSS